MDDAKPYTLDELNAPFGVASEIIRIRATVEALESSYTEEEVLEAMAWSWANRSARTKPDFAAILARIRAARAQRRGELSQSIAAPTEEH